jgi:hypothetical protein
MTYTLDAYNRENFYGIYREFCEQLIKKVVQKNSNSFSANYMNRVSIENNNNTANLEVTSLQGTTDSNGNIGFQQQAQVQQQQQNTFGTGEYPQISLGGGEYLQQNQGNL